jgi:hypothetical protein
MNFLEKDMENLILKDPKKYLNEDGLQLISRQYSIGNYRFDLLFEDRHGAKLIVEIQRGTLDRNHTYKIFDYYDEFKERNPNEFVELMVIANKIPRERRNRLKSMGITFKEIPQNIFLEDPNFKDIKVPIPHDSGGSKQRIIEKDLGLNHNVSAGDSINGKRRFEGLIERVTWKAECVKLSKMTDHRKAQLIKVFKIYGGLSIPYSHFTIERLKIKSLSNNQIFPVICAYHIGCFDKLENELVLKRVCIKDFSQSFSEIDKLSGNRDRQHELTTELTKLENCGLVSIVDQIVEEVVGEWDDWGIRDAWDVSRQLIVMGPGGEKYIIKLWGKPVGEGYVCIEMRGNKNAMERLKRELSIEKLIRKDNCFYPKKFGSKGQRTKDVNELKQRVSILQIIAQTSTIDMLSSDIKKFLSECY